MDRSIVITGVGTVCAMGVGMPSLWAGLVEGRSAIRRLGRVEPSGFRSRFGGEVENFAAKDHVPKGYRKAVKVMARDTELAVGAAMMAANDAGLVTRSASFDAETPVETTYPAPRMGCHVGAGLIPAEATELASALATAVGPEGRFSLKTWGESGMGNLQPLWMLKYLPNMLACHVSIIHGCEGPSNTITCGEASGLLSLGESLRTIERGAADACLAGGGESKLAHVAMMRLELSGRLAEVPDDADPARIVRAYDPASPGTLIGEGAGILVLERLERARARGVRPYAAIAGFGAGQAALADLERGDPDEGLVGAIEGALADAGTTPDAIGAIVPLGLGLPNLDHAERGALERVFGPRTGSIPLVTLVGALGNCMAGHAGLAAGVGAMMVRERRAPGSSRPLAGDVLVCTGSMGGQSAAMVLRSVG